MSLSLDAILGVGTANAWGLPYLLGVLMLRALPVLALVLHLRDVTTRAKLSSLAVYAGVVWSYATLSPSGWTDLGLASLAYGYFWVIAEVLHSLMNVRSAGEPAMRALPLVCLVLCWVIPAITLSGSSALVFLVLGTEVTLAAYSFCLEGRSASAAECRQFLLVNPTLVWATRMERLDRPASRFRTLSRIAGGCVALLLGFWVQALDDNMPHAPASSTGASVTLGVAADAVWTAGVSFIVLYAAQSGLASIRIGLLRLSGYAVPECYDKPWSAGNPAEFWMRWNRWVGGWFRRYVFRPVLRKAPRSRASRVGWLAYSGATAATFALVGLYHDAYAWAVTRDFTWHRFAWFLAAGMATLTWVTLRRRIARWATGIMVKVPSQLRVVLVGTAGTLEYLAFLAVAVCAVLQW